MKSFLLTFSAGTFFGLVEAFFALEQSAPTGENFLLFFYAILFYGIIPAVFALLISSARRSLHASTCVAIALFFFVTPQFVVVLWSAGAARAILSIASISILAGITAAIVAGLLVSKFQLLCKAQTWLLLNFVLLILSLSSLFFGHAEAGAGQAQNKPNFLLISIDTLRVDRLGCYGYEAARTPNIDGLANEGILFEQAIAPVPLTGPSHISMLTGLYPSNHGALVNGMRVTEGVSLLPQILSEKGYQTAAFVSGFTLKNSATALAHSFSHYSENFGPWWIPDTVWNLKLPDVFATATSLMTGTQIERLERNAFQTTQDAVSWFHQRDSARPFFLFVHYFDPHAPYEPPSNYRPSPGAEKQKLYDGEIAFTDEQIGRLMKEVDDSAKNTIVIVTADHGESLGEHGYYFDHGNYVYDTCMRVPLIIRFPDRRHANSRRTEQVGLIDITPTILQAAGLKTVERMDGTGLTPLIQNSKSHRPHLFGYARENERGAAGSRYFLRKDGWKLIWNFDSRKSPAYEELYDLTSDPDEVRNLIPLAPPVLQLMKDQLSDSVRTQKDVPTQAPDEQLRERLRSLGYL